MNLAPQTKSATHVYTPRTRAPARVADPSDRLGALDRVAVHHPCRRRRRARPWSSRACFLRLRWRQGKVLTAFLDKAPMMSRGLLLRTRAACSCSPRTTASWLGRPPRECDRRSPLLLVRFVDHVLRPSLELLALLGHLLAIHLTSLEPLVVRVHAGVDLWRVDGPPCTPTLESARCGRSRPGRSERAQEGRPSSRRERGGADKRRCSRRALAPSALRTQRPEQAPSLCSHRASASRSWAWAWAWASAPRPSRART